MVVHLLGRVRLHTAWVHRAKETLHYGRQRHAG
jgi:hypothetical protein